MSPDRLSSCGGQGYYIASVLARFSTLEGYASRNLRNGVGSASADDRPPSWFSSEVERRQTRSSNLGFRACMRPERRTVRESRMGLRAADGTGKQHGLV